MFQCPLCWARDWNVSRHPDCFDDSVVRFSALFVGRVIGTVNRVIRQGC